LPISAHKQPFGSYLTRRGNFTTVGKVLFSRFRGCHA
jgi:hypothetical protein